MIPREQFSHFSINVSDPAFFFAATRWFYVGETIDTEWGGCKSISAIDVHCNSSGGEAAIMLAWQTALVVQHLVSECLLASMALPM